MTEFTDTPGDFIAQRLNHRGAEPLCFSLSWTHEQYYCQGQPAITLSAVWYVDDMSWCCAITDDRKALSSAFNASRTAATNPHECFIETVRKLKVQPLDLASPLPLETVTVPKPWGREIWYTGIEARGVCRIQGTPVPWLLSMAPEFLTGNKNGAEPILLKVLDPLPDETYGDLYFELHEEKTELYVVTHVDSDAWPNGVGKIRYGFDDKILSQYASEAEFRQAYLDSVNAYQQVRAKIDEQLDAFRVADGFSPDDIVPPAKLEAWKARLDPELNQREREYRASMNAFTALHRLNVGDVVEVPPLTPHALQHGVRVIEFQTPHYERQILSFAQKVLTQSGWDTEAAMAKARLNADPNANHTLVSEDRGHHRVDIIGDFEQFQVQRVALAPNANWSLASTGTYVIVAGVKGANRVGETSLHAEQACYIPASSQALDIVNIGDTQSMALVACPGRHEEA